MVENRGAARSAKASRFVTRQSVTIARYPCPAAQANEASVSATPTPALRLSGNVAAKAR